VETDPAYRSAVRSLALREHSRLELREKLLRKFDDPAAVEAALDRVAREGLQSDRRYAEAYARAKGSRFGSPLILYELRRKGIPDDVAAEALAPYADEDRMADAALECLRKKFRAGARGSDDRARLARFLAGRGFPSGAARRAIAAHLAAGAGGE